MEASKTLRDMPLSEILGTALRLYGDTVLPAVPIALVANLPLLAMSNLSLEPGVTPPAELAVTLAVIVVATGIAVSAITRVLLGAAIGRPVALSALLRLTARRSLISVTLAYALTSFLANAGLLMLVLPGMLMGGLFAATLPVVLVEGRSTVPGMGRSAGLLRRDLLKAMAGFAFGALVSELLPVGLLLALQTVTGPSPFSPLLAVAINGMTLPVALAVNVTLYCSARVVTGTAPEALRAEIQAATGDPTDSAPKMRT
jgi:hypothetical protein